MSTEPKQGELLFYSDSTGKRKIAVMPDRDNDTVWTSQKNIAEIFGVSISTISEHLQNIFKTNELTENSVLRKFRITAADGKEYLTNFYNLDAIIAVGYRVNSYQATQFRIWATTTLKEYLIKGFSLDDERLKQGKNLFDKDYFNELLERIREIRASERMFYQKITDIYATSVDYDAHAPITQTFFATVQNKLEYAITHHTASEIIKKRANSNSPNMGLTTWKNSKEGGKILKTDVIVAKNYLSKEELDELNALVTMYLDYAELQAKRNKTMKMADWIERLDSFLQFNEYDLLKNAGNIRADFAKKFAEKEFEKFRIIQDKEYKSDFDKAIDIITKERRLPSKGETDTQKEKITEFNSKLKTAINYNPKSKS